MPAIQWKQRASRRSTARHNAKHIHLAACIGTSQIAFAICAIAMLAKRSPLLLLLGMPLGEYAAAFFATAVVRGIH